MTKEVEKNCISLRFGLSYISILIEGEKNE